MVEIELDPSGNTIFLVVRKVGAGVTRHALGLGHPQLGASLRDVLLVAEGKRAALTPQVSGFLPPGECKTCDAYRQRMPHKPMAPRHHASANCESGKRPHCSCDTCF